MMFGVIPINHAAIVAAGGAGAPAPIYVQAGWDNAGPNVQRIISFDITCNGGGHNSCTAVDDTHIVNDPNIPGATISRRALFEREFRKIASTSVGRVLLYRILIEIRRHNPGGNDGCIESPTFDVTAPETSVTDRCRNVNIAYGYVLHSIGFGFSETAREILFVGHLNNIFGAPTPFSVIGKSTREGYTHITQSSSTIDVSIFHEMLHWFHHLRNPKRNEDEINENNALHFNSASVPQYYWHDIDCCILAWNASRENNYAPIWSLSFGPHSHLDFEEMRTILGMPHNSSLNGDDLSENLYRMCTGLPLRFGYSGENFYEDRKVVDRVINVCLKNYIVYVTGKDSTVDFAYQIGSRQLFGKGKRK